MQIRVMSILRGLSSAENLSTELPIYPNFRVTTDYRSIDDMRAVFDGMKETWAIRYLDEARVHFGTELIIEGSVEVPDSQTQEDWDGAVRHCVESIGSAIMIFSQALWTSVDHSLEAEFVWYTVRNGDVCGCGIRGLGSRYVNADGQHEDTCVSVEQMRSSIATINALFATMGSDEQALRREIDNKGWPKPMRFVWLLHAARENLHRSQRIANYVTCLECLLADSHQELRHRMSERLAVLLHDDVGDRVQAYKLSLKAYDERSHYVHGQQVARSAEQQAVVRFCDDSLRKLVLLGADGALRFPFLFGSLADGRSSSVSLGDEFLNRLFA